MLELKYERIHGIQFPKKFKGNAAMGHGNETEDEARDFAAELMQTEIKQVGFIKYNDDIGCSPDGLIGDDGLVEIKCPELLTYMRYEQQYDLHGISFKGLPKAYRDQIQGQMWVCDRQWCEFVLYDSRYPSRPILTERFKRDDEYIKALRIDLTMFVTELKKLMEKLTNSAPF